MKEIKLTESEADDIKCKMIHFVNTVKPWVKGVQLSEDDWNELVDDCFRETINKLK